MTTKPRRRIKHRPEEALQRAVAQYLDLALPPEAAWTAFKAGQLGKINGGIAKSMGLKPGFPDLMIVYQGRYIGIELKTGRVPLSDAQKERHQEIRNAGGFVDVCRSVKEVQDRLEVLTIPLRARVA